jgi:hypothetical protein
MTAPQIGDLQPVPLPRQLCMTTRHGAVVDSHSCIGRSTERSG